MLMRTLAAYVLSAPMALAGPIDRAAIEKTLEKMEAAAMAGDRDAWLATIAAGDPEWTKEQTYFANDLKKKKAEKLDLTLGEVRDVNGDAVGELTFAWNIEGEPSRRVSFEARFVPADGQWLYAGETWAKREAPGVIVLHDPGLDDMAAKVVEAFSNIRPNVDAFFEHDGTPFTQRVQKIKVYGSMKHLQQSICLSYKDGLSGWNEPDESIKLLASQRSTVRGLETLLAHEYGHVATFASGPLANDTMPWWVLEGAAELSAAACAGGSQPDRRVARWAKEGNLAPWPALADFDTIEQKWYGHVYTQGHSMLKYIEGRWEKPGRNAWLRAMGAGKPLDRATREVMGMSFDDLHAAWRATLPAEEKEDKKAEEPKVESPT
ncbi:MAG: hypothetical protein HBSAPP03_06320 [Phycisphaerae bacterium]|nr:MAG: hypothetical protein HBSAPP03_06320 [Phycisphaerae bacterium]